eukprot:NODE_1093_length_1007_cov_40.877871_g908_i0.p1 GENE.NODE_1093_length_1007_cov_40.877871_g908_i0~~NODE_1093_length_1007_cov_40.877871_g908_i0.p1  ORF type:complete len:295 (-),score=46.46 NODE_1093_length_1007_cov_40.877871_g908_i0:71-955(-)
MDFARIVQQLRSGFRRGRQATPDGKAGILPLVVAFGGWAIYKSMFNVDGGYRAVKFNVFSGMSDSVYAEGTHFLVPWLERPIIYNVRTQASEISSATGSRDLQTVHITVRVLTRPDMTRLVKIYRELGVDYAERVLPSVTNETLKAVIAQFNASELLTRRSEVSAAISQLLGDRAEEFGIKLDDVAITHLAFSKEYTNAVEAKQIAEQEAGRARFIAERAVQEKKSVEVLAEGESEAIRLIGTAMKNNPGFLQIRRIEAAKTIANTLASSKNKLYLDGDSLLLSLEMMQGYTTK